LKLFSRLSPASWLTARAIFGQVFGLGLFAIQAPLLGPRAFGLISMVMIFVGACESVLIEAAAESLISIRVIEDQHYSTMTCVNVGIAVLFGIVIFIAAPQIAALFGASSLVSILRWMSILPAITAFSAAPTAATKRDMQFRPLAIRSMGSVLVGGCVGLILTLTGAGVWALVWQALVTRLVAAWVLWYAVPLDFRLGFSKRHFDDLLRFAAPTMLSRVMNWAGAQVPRLILGIYWGPVQLGLFSLAGRLSDILMEIVVVPRYAVARVELRKFAFAPADFDDALRQISTRMSVFCFPVCLGGAVILPTLFHVWLNPGWYLGIIPAQFMLLICMPLITHYCVGAALLALNHQSTEALGSIAQTVAIVVIVFLSAPLSLNVACAAIALRPLVLLPLPLALLKVRSATPIRSLLISQARPLVAALVMGACVWFLREFLSGFLNNLTLLLVLACVGALIYGLLIVVLMPEFAAKFVHRAPSED